MKKAHGTKAKTARIEDEDRVTKKVVSDLDTILAQQRATRGMRLARR